MTRSIKEKEVERPDLMELDLSSPNKASVKSMPTPVQQTPGVDQKGENLDAESSLKWAIKYQPKSLKEFISHRKKADFLRTLVCSGHNDHCIFQGPPGVGKTTMALAMLRQDLGVCEINETREEIREFKLIRSPETNLDFEDFVNSTSTTVEGPIDSIEIKVKASQLHMEIDLSEIKWYMDEAILELIKGLHKNKQSRTKAMILDNADCLSDDCQVKIRKFLEAGGERYQVIFCCYDIFKLQHLMPICIIVQLQPPSDKEIVDVLSFIASKEGIELPEKLARRIAKKSKHCLQQAIRSFAATRQLNYPFTEDQTVMTGWEKELVNAARSIIEDQTPTGLFTFRQKLQILLKHNICPEFIFTTLVDELKRQLDDQNYPQLNQLYQAYAPERRRSFEGKSPGSIHGRSACDKLRTRVNPFLKIEEFVAMFMSLCKSSS